jgi:hypothetical protein
MSSGALGYHEMYITEIAECIRKIYVKQKEKKWVAWVQNGDIYFSPHTQEVLVVYNAVITRSHIKRLYRAIIFSAQVFIIWWFLLVHQRRFYG